jgi:hypothetical protein
MILLLALLLAGVWGLAHGGRLSEVLSLALRGYGFALAAFGIQVAVIYLPLTDRFNLLALLLVLS